MSVESNYGKYAVPDALHALIRIQRETPHPHGHLLGLYFGLEGLNSRYSNTPADAIAFARPGVDGIHYAFLTDFGGVPDLDEAWIVRVSPMDFGEPVKLAARNLYDFLCMLVYHPVEADLLDVTADEERIVRTVRDCPAPDYGIAGAEQSERLIRSFELKPIVDLASYYRACRQARIRDIVSATGDGIGVVRHEAGADGAERVDGLTPEEALVRIREAVSAGRVYDNADLKRRMIAQLEALGCPDEAVRIRYPEPPAREPVAIVEARTVKFARLRRDRQD